MISKVLISIGNPEEEYSQTYLKPLHSPVIFRRTLVSKYLKNQIKTSTKVKRKDISIKIHLSGIQNKGR